MSKVASEDTLFMIDVSRSMFKADILGKSRIFWALLSLKEIIERKHKKDENDRYSIILFSDKSYESKDYVYNFNDLFKYVEENAELSGMTHLPLDKAIKIIINEKRKIGQKIFRVIIISDGNIQPAMSNPIKFAKIAKELGIIVDVIRFGRAQITGNILQRISEITGGAYHYINDDQEFYRVIEKVADKKKIKVATLFDESAQDELDTLSKDIASPLLKMEDLTEEQRNQINFKELKCSICHSDKCYICETSFYGCGRFCPNCLKPLHLHCAIKWAETQQKNNKDSSEDYKVLRCPFCYYLLKIPIIVKKEIPTTKSTEKSIARKIKFSEEAGELMMSICGHPDCGIMFDESIDTYVYKCEACGSYFHEDCFLKEYSQTGKCPYCHCDIECLE
ncbi:MAG: VWA domain-containing protein [Promethearchaeota archaeon]